MGTGKWVWTSTQLVPGLMRVNLHCTDVREVQWKRFVWEWRVDQRSAGIVQRLYRWDNVCCCFFYDVDGRTRMYWNAFPWHETFGDESVRKSEILIGRTLRENPEKYVCFCFFDPNCMARMWHWLHEKQKVRCSWLWTGWLCNENSLPFQSMTAPTAFWRIRIWNIYTEKDSMTTGIP